MRVLVCDDDRCIRLLLRDILEREDCDVLEASNGLECLARLKDDPEVDLLILDALMPLMVGVEVLQRAWPAFPPTIALTCDPEIAGQAMIRAGAAECLGKPFAVQELLAAVARVGRQPLCV